MAEYTFTGETKSHQGVVLKRIKRNSDGLVGGYLESESNLSQEGTCFLYDESTCYGAAKIVEDAQVYGDVHDDATVSGSATIQGQVYEHATVSGSAVIEGRAYGEAVVTDQAQVFGEAFGQAVVDGNAKIFGRVFGTAHVSGHDIVMGERSN
jgi:hypothetical protein